MNFYTKNDDGEYTEVDTKEMFKDRHDQWVRSETSKIKEDLEKTYREEMSKTIAKETEDRIKNEYQPKLDDATKKVSELETSLRQKTIAAEYGFKPGTEKYLGTGSEDDMRKEADVLKNSFGGTPPAGDKHTTDSKSKTQERTGVKVVI